MRKTLLIGLFCCVFTTMFASEKLNIVQDLNERYSECLNQTDQCPQQELLSLYKQTEKYCSQAYDIGMSAKVCYFFTALSLFAVTHRPFVTFFTAGVGCHLGTQAVLRPMQYPEPAYMCDLKDIAFAELKARK